MPVNCSQIFKLLSGQTGQNMHRLVFVLAGDEAWQQEFLKKQLAGREKDSLWLADQAVNNFPFVEINKANSWLGKEKRVVIFDANKSFEPDSFAAISGIIVGGGLLFLLFPRTDIWNDVYDSLFGQRLLKSICNTSAIQIIDETNSELHINLPESIKINKAKCCLPFLTIDQQLAVEKIEQQALDKNNAPVVLVSDRGRGKSAALGIAAASLIKAGLKNIVVTSPRLRASDVIFKHAAENLPGAELKRGSIILGDSRIQFYSPDQLIHENIQAELLLVDEAAAIPVPLLTSFLEKYPQCVYATTVHGYEGTGRGFALRFNKILNEKKPGWFKCQLLTPIRWAENDPLEKWMFDLLCLDAEIVESEIIDKIDKEKLEFILVKQSDISANESLLKEIFSLLVLAHYRTQPGDLVRLLDDENLSLYVAKYKHHILAVALVSHEGLFTNELSSQVYQGKRRPPGHLLAQALTYHCGIESAATLNYSRVMRIAVHPAFQQQGIGTSLLKFIISNEKQAGYDAIGTSFGMNKPLLKFWRDCGFNVVRIGFKREQTSGEHAAIMLLALSAEGEKIYSQAQVRFLNQLPYWFKGVLADIAEDMQDAFPLSGKTKNELDADDLKDLQSYINYSRLFELCIYAVSQFVTNEIVLIANQDFPAEYRQVLELKIAENKSWKEIVSLLKLTGKDAAQKLFHQAIVYLYEHSQG